MKSTSIAAVLGATAILAAGGVLRAAQSTPAAEAVEGGVAAFRLVGLKAY
jgi:hypothetical protein